MLRLPPISTLFPYTTLFRSATNSSATYLFTTGVAVNDGSSSQGSIGCYSQNGVTTTNPHATTSTLDRKSTRLNSSHGYISYAVLRLKKKKKLNTLSSRMTIC